MNLSGFEANHGEEDSLKVCCSALCNSTAFACMSCEECQEVHEHQGNTTLIRWSILDADIDSMTIKPSFSTKL